MIKRPMMTREALKFSDKAIVTDDNPRNEDPKKLEPNDTWIIRK